ncbi:MAG: glutamate racemase [Bacteroidia bacterium]
MHSGPIGIFDSGLGGLSVWREVQRLLPDESLIYLGDSGRCPYGPRPHGEILRFSQELSHWLVGQGCKLLVVACNTITGAAIDALRARYPLPFVGMEPALKPAAQQTHSGVIGVLATQGTFAGRHFQRALAHYGSQVEVQVQVGTGLVELVEQGQLDTPAARALLGDYLLPMLARGADQVVLGCTHYPFLRPLIEEILDGRAAIIDPAPAVARQVQRLLHTLDLEAPADQVPMYDFCTTGSVGDLQEFVAAIAPSFLANQVQFRGIDTRQLSLPAAG